MIVQLQSALHSWQLTGKRILVRADLNVPLEYGKIVNDYRLQQILPTIDLIKQHGGKIILMTHLGRPKKPAEKYSTKHLLTWFAQRGYLMQFASDPYDAYQKSFTDNDKILLLENLRFFAGEQSHDESFAKVLAELGNYYIDDAFGALHRTDTSITLVPRFFPRDRRSIGLLVEHEFHMLNKLLTNPKRPYDFIIGGVKIDEKIPLIHTMLDQVDRVFLCPAIVFSFLAAEDISVGKSIVDKNAFTICKDILRKAKQQHKKIYFPDDYQVAHETVHGILSIVDADKIPNNTMGISIGPKTIASWQLTLTEAKTILFNGLPGIPKRPETLAGVHAILEAMVQSDAYTVIGGGDTVAVAQQFGFINKMSFCSTGGGAMIAYLNGKPLPGIMALIDQKELTF